MASADAKELTHQPQGQDSYSHQSTDQSQRDDTALGGVNSQDQCISSDSDDSYKKSAEGQMKPLLFMGNPNFAMIHEVEKTATMTRAPYGYADPYFNGLYTAYGPQAMIQPHTVNIAPARVPLPLDLSEDGPIYVNAKQYHGIIRRREVRAKLEAQNKLVKNRRPYLHESRHKHALNRVRGSGGRFLPTRKPEQSQSIRFSSSHYPSEARLLETRECEHPMTSCHVFNRDMMFLQSDHGFSSISEKWEIRGNEGFGNHNHDRASVGR